MRLPKQRKKVEKLEPLTTDELEAFAIKAVEQYLNREEDRVASVSVVRAGNPK